MAKLSNGVTWQAVAVALATVVLAVGGAWAVRVEKTDGRQDEKLSEHSETLIGHGKDIEFIQGEILAELSALRNALGVQP